MLALLDAQLATADKQDRQIADRVRIKRALERKSLRPARSVVHVAAEQDARVVEQRAVPHRRRQNLGDETRKQLDSFQIASGNDVEVGLLSLVMGSPMHASQPGRENQGADP